MKNFKSSIFAVATIALTVFGSSAKASDAELMPYLQATAQEYLVPYLSRDLGKKVDVRTENKRVASNRVTPMLVLDIPNATCEEFFFVALMMYTRTYHDEFVADTFEQNKNLTKADIDASMSIYRFFSGAEGVLTTSMNIDPKMKVCEPYIKMGKWEKENPLFLKREEYIKKNLRPRVQKLRDEGRL